MTFSHAPSVLILGGGPAGLTTAYRLASTGYRVTVTDMPFGREYSPGDAGIPLFSLLGCHRNSLALLREAELLSPSEKFAESTLEFLLPNGRLARFPRSRFPNPLHQILTIGRFTGLSWDMRWKLLSWLEQLWEGSLQLATDLELRTAQDWLDTIHQDSNLKEAIWTPLALWLTGNELKHLSADAFAASLKSFFLSEAAASRLYYPRTAWQDFFTRPMVASITRAGGTVLPDLRSMKFDYQENRVTAAGFADGSRLTADWFVSTLSPQQLTPLLPERWLTRYAYFQQISELTTLPWTAVDLSLPTVGTSPRTILNGAGPAPVISCHPSSTDHGSILSLYIPGKHEQDGIDRIAETTLRSLNFPTARAGSGLNHPQGTTFHTLALYPGAKTKRPIQRSPIANLCVAGAWTDTGWPANIESAVVSGERCAQLITESRRLDDSPNRC